VYWLLDRDWSRIIAKKSKYNFVCCEKNTGKERNRKICNISPEMWGEFKYLLLTPINKYCTQDNFVFV
jgi:hypothetical protein